MTDPIDNITWVKANTLNPNSWNPNRVLSTEIHLLERSLLTIGWIQPILANTEGLIIDGFHRWRISQDSPKVKKRWGGKVPVATLDVDTPTAMAITVRINRAKGVHTGEGMSELAREIVHVYGWTEEDLGREIGADEVEVTHLLFKDVFEAKNTKQHAYSQAWYPEMTDDGEDRE